MRLLIGNCSHSAVDCKTTSIKASIPRRHRKRAHSVKAHECRGLPSPGTSQPIQTLRSAPLKISTGPDNVDASPLHAARRKRLVDAAGSGTQEHRRHGIVLASAPWHNLQLAAACFPLQTAQLRRLHI